MTSQLKLKIADLVFQATTEEKKLRLAVSPAYQAFLTSDGEADLCLRVHLGPSPYEAHRESVFQSGSMWSLYRSDGRNIIVMKPVGKQGPQRMLVKHTVALNSDFTSGDMYICEQPIMPETTAQDAETTGYPLEYPLGELLAINLLSRGRGCEVHGCGMALNGEGLLFLGGSGIGKSTLANLWKKRPEVTVLSDDRIIVRRRAEGYRIYGTPWHGDAGTASPHSALLRHIYFLQQAPRTHILPLAPAEAAKRMLVVSFPTFYWDQGMAFFLSFIGQLTEEVACCEFRFVPDDSCIELVMREAGLGSA